MNLDNQSAIRRLDKKQVAESIANLPKQMMAAFASAQKVKMPFGYSHAEQIVFCGMGGSNLASEIVRSLYGVEMKIPMLLVRGYDLPGFVNKKTLVIIDSYSGNTAETESCLEQAIEADAKIICIASGGLIEVTAKKKRLPLIKLDPSLNPSGQPRYDVGSQIGAVLSIFEQLKFIRLDENELSEAAACLVKDGYGLLPSEPLKSNIAKKLAQKLLDKNILIFSGGFLSANGHILANQINESAKQLAVSHKIPELNHHLLEGLVKPKKISKQTTVIILSSPNMDEKIANRIKVTKKVLDKIGIDHLTIDTGRKCEEAGRLTETLQILSVGSWVSFYLAMINEVNPAEIPWVDYFKKELAKLS